MYVTIITSDNLFFVDFGIFSNFVGYKKAIFQKRMISMQLIKDDSFIRIENSQGENWAISFNQYGESLIIASVNGITPTDNVHLYDLLTTAMQ